jgi:hypothetical protein
MLRIWLAATTVVAMMTGVAVAQTSSSVGPAGPQQPGVGEPIMTSGGSAVVPRYSGSMAPATPSASGNLALPMYTDYSGVMANTAIRGSGSQGMLMDDGNATGMIVPGQPPKLVSTPE